jgi:hypothetical protein
MMHHAFFVVKLLEQDPKCDQSACYCGLIGRNSRNAPSMDTEAKLIDSAVKNPTSHCKPHGWLHWPEHPWMSYQFRRALGGTQEGDGAVSECFPAACRIMPGGQESWHDEWLIVAERNHRRGDEAGADHCQHDNPTIGQEIMANWLADRFGIDQRRLRQSALA